MFIKDSLIANQVIKNKNFNCLIEKDRYGNYKIRGGQAVLVCHKSDFFIEEADAWRAEVWAMIKERKDLHFNITTRRISRALECLPSDWGSGYANVTITLSVEDEKSFLEKMPYLLALKANEKTLLICPLLSEINLKKLLKGNEIAYINCGGENYYNARPLVYEHALKLSQDSLALGIPFYFFDTGMYIIKNNKRYFIPQDKRYSQAFLSNLSHN